MKKILLCIICIQLSGCAWAFYDFCESPADYNTFPAAYDFKTEYWKDIPQYGADKIEYKDMKNEHPIFPIKQKKKKEEQKK